MEILIHGDAIIQEPKIRTYIGVCPKCRCKFRCTRKEMQGNSCIDKYYAVCPEQNCHRANIEVEREEG